jgi:hypothetical protein
MLKLNKNSNNIKLHKGCEKNPDNNSLFITKYNNTKFKHSLDKYIEFCTFSKSQPNSLSFKIIIFLYKKTLNEIKIIIKYIIGQIQIINKNKLIKLSYKLEIIIDTHEIYIYFYKNSLWIELKNFTYFGLYMSFLTNINQEFEFPSVFSGFNKYPTIYHHFDNTYSDINFLVSPCLATIGYNTKKICFGFEFIIDDYSLVNPFQRIRFLNSSKYKENSDFIFESQILNIVKKLVLSKASFLIINLNIIHFSLKIHFNIERLLEEITSSLKKINKYIVVSFTYLFLKQEALEYYDEVTRHYIVSLWNYDKVYLLITCFTYKYKSLVKSKLTKIIYQNILKKNIILILSKFLRNTDSILYNQVKSGKRETLNYIKKYKKNKLQISMIKINTHQNFMDKYIFPYLDSTSEIKEFYRLQYNNMFKK